MSRSSRRQLADEYSRVAVAYARHWGPVIASMAQGICARLPHHAGRRVLDVGCGTGTPWLDDLEASLRVGADHSWGMLAAGKRQWTRNLLVTDAQELALASHTFDLVTLTFVLFHLPDPVRGLQEVKRVLRPGGHVAVTTWGEGQETPGTDVFREELDAIGAPEDPRANDVSQHDLMDSVQKLERLLREGGLQVETVWAEVHHHPFSPESLFALHTTVGSPSRRLRCLPADGRKTCEARIRSRLQKMNAQELIYSPSILHGVGST